MITLSALGQAVAERITGARTVEESFAVKVTCDMHIEGADVLSDEAQDRIASLVRREATRIAQIAAVNVRDQKVERLNAEKRRAEPPAKERSHVIVAAGSKDPETAVVVRGSVKVGGKTVKAAPAGGAR